MTDAVTLEIPIIQGFESTILPTPPVVIALELYFRRGNYGRSLKQVKKLQRRDRPTTYIVDNGRIRLNSETKAGDVYKLFATLDTNFPIRKCYYCSAPYIKEEPSGPLAGWYTCRHAPNCPAEHLKEKDL